MKKILFVFLYCFLIFYIEGRKHKVQSPHKKSQQLVRSHHKPILRAGHRVTLNQAHIVSDLKYTNNIRVSTISGKPICEIQNIDMSYSTLLGWGTDKQGGGMGYVLGSNAGQLQTEDDEDWFSHNIAKFNTQSNQACSYPWVDGDYTCQGTGDTTFTTYFDCLANKGWWKKKDCRNSMAEIPKCDNNYPATIMPVSGFKRYIQFKLIEGEDASWYDAGASDLGWDISASKYKIYECDQPFDTGTSQCRGEDVPDIATSQTPVLEFYVGDDIYFTLEASDGYSPPPAIEIRELYISGSETKASNGVYKEKYQPLEDPVTGEWSTPGENHFIRFNKASPVNWRPNNMRMLGSNGQVTNPPAKSNPKEFGWKVDHFSVTNPDFTGAINAYLIKVWENPMETYDVYLDYPTNKDGTDQEYFMVDVDLMGLVKPVFKPKYITSNPPGSVTTEADQVFSHYEPASLVQSTCTWEHWINCADIMNICGAGFWGADRSTNFVGTNDGNYPTMSIVRYDDDSSVQDFTSSSEYGWEGESCNRQWVQEQLTTVAGAEGSTCAPQWRNTNFPYDKRFVTSQITTKNTNSLTYCNGISLQTLTSEMVETDCSLNFFKNYNQGDGECSQCVGVCLRAQYLTTCDETGAACTDLLEGEYCPPSGDKYITPNAVSPGGNDNAVYNDDSLADCDGICGGKNRDCPYMYGWVMSKNRVWGASGRESSNSKCSLNCVRWRGTMRMDNGFEEYITEPLGTIKRNEQGVAVFNAALGNYEYENPKICELLLKRDFDKKSVLNHPWSRSCMKKAQKATDINSNNFDIGTNSQEDLDALSEAICPSGFCTFQGKTDLEDLEYGVWRSPAIKQSNYDIRHHQSVNAAGIPSTRDDLVVGPPADINVNQAGSAPN